MSLTGGGARQKRWRRPHERGLSVPKEPALLRDLEANQTAVHGSRRDRLDRLPLPWSAGRRTEGRAQRHVSARAQHEGGREGAPLPLGPSSTIARNVMRGNLMKETWTTRAKPLLSCLDAQGGRGSGWRSGSGQNGTPFKRLTGAHVLSLEIVAMHYVAGRSPRLSRLHQGRRPAPPSLSTTAHTCFIRKTGF
jgi:hypothetical protein